MFQDIKILDKSSDILIPDFVKKYLDDKIIIYNKIKSADLNEKIGILTGYELIKSFDSCGGFCDTYNKEIAIIEVSEPVLLHEICHAFQSDMGIYNKSNLISQEIKFEQQCESMARYMHQKINKNPGLNLFTSYFKKQDIDFLKNWYHGYLEVDI